MSDKKESTNHSFSPNGPGCPKAKTFQPRTSIELQCLTINLDHQVMDEADRILNMDFEVEVDKILRVIPRERRTYLFSATMTKKVQKLQRASLRDPVKVEVSTKYQTVDQLQQYYVFIPVKYKVRELNYWYEFQLKLNFHPTYQSTVFFHRLFQRHPGPSNFFFCG